MQTKIQKWGNSLGLRIPRTFAAEVQVEEGSTVDLSVEDGRLLVRPLRGRKYAVSDLLKKVTRRNLHGEVPAGGPTGREGWYVDDVVDANAVRTNTTMISAGGGLYYVLLPSSIAPAGTSGSTAVAIRRGVSSSA